MTAIANAEVLRLDLRPGDRLVIRFPYYVPTAERRKITGEVRHELALGDDVPVLVIGDATLAVLGVDEETPPGG